MKKNLPANSHMNDYIENILAENLTLKRKLDSKSEALLILTKELNNSRSERDQFQKVAEEIQDKYINLRKTSPGYRVKWYSDGQEDSPVNSASQNLNETREINKSLKLEVESLRQKLRDALGDIKALRSKLNHQKWSSASESDSTSYQLDKEELVEQLEKMDIKRNQLETELESAFDEKEELITERDAYKCKVHRLNHQLNNLLKGDNQNLIDLDALIMENRFMQERLQQVNEDLRLTHQTVVKYKNMLEKKRSKGGAILESISGNGNMVTEEQVRELLEDVPLQNKNFTFKDMRLFCQTLLEGFNDKSLALLHQKKANRILAARICELEQRIENMGMGKRIVDSPSKLLLEGYSAIDVNKEEELPEIALFKKQNARAHLQSQKQAENLQEQQSLAYRSDIEFQDLKPLPPELDKLVAEKMQEIIQETESRSSSS